MSQLFGHFCLFISTRTCTILILCHRNKLLYLYPSTGMLPVISTRPLSNFELTLSPDGTRVGNHRCSNLLDFNEIQTGHGFITDATKNPEIIGETSPYQYNAIMRSANSLRFYRNLNLEACLWEFTSYYDMSELLNDCGGSIGTDGQVGNTYCDARRFCVMFNMQTYTFDNFKLSSQRVQTRRSYCRLLAVHYTLVFYFFFFCSEKWESVVIDKG